MSWEQSDNAWLVFEFTKASIVDSRMCLQSPPILPRSKKHRHLKKWAKKIGISSIECSEDGIYWDRHRLYFKRKGSHLHVTFSCTPSRHYRIGS